MVWQALMHVVILIPLQPSDDIVFATAGFPSAGDATMQHRWTN